MATCTSGDALVLGAVSKSQRKSSLIACYKLPEAPSGEKCRYCSSDTLLSSSGNQGRPGTEPENRAKIALPRTPSQKSLNRHLSRPGREADSADMAVPRAAAGP